MTEDRLARQIEELSREMAQLRRRVEQLEAGSPVRAEMAETTAAASQAAAGGVAPPPQAADSGEELLTWMGRSTLLPRISATCFILVLALILRTLTDNDLLDKTVGSWVGTAYAALLIAFGWHGYRRSRPLAPVFVVSGAVLMYTIVIETHAHFGALPSVPAYLILAATGMVMASISFLFANALPVMVGTLGMGVAAVAIDYPNPYFPHLAMLLLIANLLGSYATRLQRCSWLRWILLILTMGMVQVWGVKIVLTFGPKGTTVTAFGAAWFLPVVALFTLAFLATAVLAVLRQGGERVSRFDLALPSVTVIWSLSASWYLLRGTGGHLPSLAVLGLLLAGGGFAFSCWLTQQGPRRAGAVTAFMVAAVAALALAVAVMAGWLPALAVLSIAAYGLAAASVRWQRGGLRLAALLLQVGGGASLALLMLDRGPASSPGGQMAVAGIAGAVGLCHYRWSRRTPLPDGAPLLSRIDPEDRSAVLLLLGALASIFFMLRTGIYLAIGGGEGVQAMAFQAGQTLVINASAAVLMLAAMRRRSAEIRNVGILVVLVGAGKVVLYDLMRIKGVPLVASVFSFGVVITLLSVILARWQRSGEESRPRALPPSSDAGEPQASSRG